MPITLLSPSPSTNPLIPIINNFDFFYKVGFAILFLLYFIFALIVIRQVVLMTETLTTEISPLLKAFAIIHAGIALSILILFIGLF